MGYKLRLRIFLLICNKITLVSSFADNCIQLQTIPSDYDSRFDKNTKGRSAVSTVSILLEVPIDSWRQRLGPGNGYITCVNCDRHPAYPTIPAVTLHADGKCQICGSHLSLYDSTDYELVCLKEAAKFIPVIRY
jgi:hypothetical protein